MKKICLFLILFVLASVFLSNKVFALTLDKIGVLETQGSTYPEWWYTGSTPTLYGTSGNGATVEISINDEIFSTTADESGNWAFYSESLTEGDHSIAISSEGSSYSFTLHLGQDVPSDLGSSGTTSESTGTPAVPDTGFGQFIALISAIVVCSAGVILWDRRSSLRAFEDKVTRDLN